MSRPNHLDLAVSSDVSDAYSGTPASSPYGPGKPNPKIEAVEDPTQDSFYRTRDAMVGGQPTVYNTDPNGGADGQSGANWGSLADVAPVVNSGSGLGGERTGWTEVLGPDRLAGDAF